VRAVLEHLIGAQMPDTTRESASLGVDTLRRAENDWIRPVDEGQRLARVRAADSPLHTLLPLHIHAFDPRLTVCRAGGMSLQLSLDGTAVHDVDVDVGYLSRGIERGVVGMSVPDAARKIAQLSLMNGVQAQIAFVAAAERCLALQWSTRPTPGEALTLARRLAIRVARVVAHLHILSGHAGFRGAARAFLHHHAGATRDALLGWVAQGTFAQPFALAVPADDEMRTMVQLCLRVRDALRVHQSALWRQLEDDVGLGTVTADDVRVVGLGHGPIALAAGVLPKTAT
jgi:hypothetical protein